MALANIKLGVKPQSWFDDPDNQDFILKKGQAIIVEETLLDAVLQLKVGDEATHLEDLPWRYITNSLLVWGAIGGDIDDQADLIALVDAAEAAANNYADTLARHLLPRFSGKRFTYAITGGYSTSGTLHTGMWLMPFIVAAPVTITNLIFNVNTPSAGSNCRVGLYSDLNGYPNSLLTSSEISSATSGEKTYTFATPMTLTGGMYYFTMQPSASAVVLYFTTAAVRLLNLNGALNGGASYFLTRAYSAWPATLPAGATIVTSSLLVETTAQ